MKTTMPSSSATTLLLSLLLFFSPLASAGLLFARQASSSSSDQSQIVNPAAISCATYSSIANLSTISSNSTYRAAFLRSSPDGTDKSATLLNTAQAQLPLLIFNENLNAQCGNASAAAIAGAASNFTNGIVAQYQIQPAVGISPNGGPGLITLILVFSIAVFLCSVFASL